MPPSHVVSRAVLALLVVALTAIVLTTVVDLDATWRQIDDTAQRLWGGLRGSVDSTTSSP